MDPLASNEIKVERKDSDEDQLMIDDDLNEEFVDEMNIEDPTDDTNDEQVRLEKLPRPVHELNCRQARTYLVKLLRAANGGQNPHYGMPDSKPPFWPDYYWPWEKLFDVHTKPRGMNEPLQYSEMMKLAIGRGYQYFGYDPTTYVRLDGDASLPQSFPTLEVDPLLAAEPMISIFEEPFIESDDFDSSKYYLKQPPRLPRPLSKVNCVQARTALAKLLRYQQCGNNPVYGSPDTEPPWWPNQLIRWVDMVDLRGKPPYLPDTKSYTDVLKIAISQAYAYYGYDPETFLDIAADAMQGLIGTKQKMFPMIPAAGIAPQPPPKFNSSACPNPNAKPTLSVDPLKDNNNEDDLEDDDEEMGELPPKLPMPVGKMNCSVTRTCLAKLIRFHCGRGQLPNYGNPASMPVWWPNHIIDWTKIKNLSHRYEGYLGNTYSNCLRIAMIRGYAHYGLDANEYVERKGIREPYQPIHNQNPLESLSANINTNPTSLVIQPRIEKTPNVQGISTAGILGMTKRQLPMLIPLSSLVSEGQYPQSLLNTRDWFPPRLAYSKAIDASVNAVKSLKPCKIILDSTKANYHDRYCLGPIREETRISRMFDFFHQDLMYQKFTDITLVADKKTPAHKENFSIKVHKLVLAAHSVSLRRILQDMNDDDNATLMLSGVTANTLKLLVEALYTGKVKFSSKSQLQQFESALTCLHSFGILLNLRAVVNLDLQDNEFDEDKENFLEDSYNVEDSQMIEMNVEDSLLLDEAVTEEEEAPLKTRAKRIKKEPEDPDEAPPTKKRARAEPEEKEEETPRRRGRRAADKSKDEAKKPNFKTVTTETLNEFMGLGQRTFVEWLQKEGFLRANPPHCSVKECQSPTKLVENKDDIDGVVWQCTSGKDHAPVSVREGSIFGRVKKPSPDSLSWIIQIILCWSENTSLMSCQQQTGAELDKIFFWYDECRDYYGTL